MRKLYPIVKGHLDSPYFIFVRKSGHLSDHDLLRLLGLGEFVSSPSVFDLSKPRIYLTEDDAWIHIADDRLYSLWHKGRHGLVEALHKSIPDIPIFSCSVGDIDWSFDFAYYASGALLRRYIVEDPRHDKNRLVVVEDFGEPLAFEKPLLKTGDELDYVLSLASGLGVKINHNIDAIRCYSRPEP